MNRALGLIVLVLAAIPCAAQVEDDAAMFKAETRKEAERRIERIREKTGKSILVVTINRLPVAEANKINMGDAGQRKELFRTIARERMEAAHLEGVLLLICETPSKDDIPENLRNVKHIEIAASDDTELLFGPWYRDHLKGRMIGSIQPDNPDQHLFRALSNRLRTSHDPDKGILAAIEYVGNKIEWNMPVDQSNLVIGLGIMAGVLGFWLVLGLVRARLRNKGPAEAGVVHADESGRSIAVLGGGIGAVSGQWVFNRLFRHRKPEPVPAPAPASEEPSHEGEETPPEPEAPAGDH